MVRNKLKVNNKDVVHYSRKKNSDVVLASLLITLNIFHNVFECLCCRLLTCIFFSWVWWPLKIFHTSLQFFEASKMTKEHFGLNIFVTRKIYEQIL